MGRRQIFIRFPFCELNCCYCDSVYAKEIPKVCEVEMEPNGGTELIGNPVDVDDVIHYIERLITPDLHSVCFTGGEPLLSLRFLFSIAERTQGEKWKNYLETSGSSLKKFESVIPLFNYAAIDVKLPNHDAVPPQKWKQLYREEIGCAKISVDRGKETIIKIVILPGTKEEDFVGVCKGLPADIKLVLQPVSPIGNITPSRNEEIFKLSSIAGEFLSNIMVIPQVHKIMGIK